MTVLAPQDRRIRPPKNMDVVRFAAGATIFDEGQHGRRAFIVRAGLVEMSKSTGAGDVVIGYIGAGEIFGEMSPIDRLPRMSSAKAVRDTECIVISRAQFARKLSRSDPFIRDLLHMLLRSMRDLTDDFVELKDRSNEEITAAQELRHGSPNRAHGKNGRASRAKSTRSQRPLHIKARTVSIKG